MAQQHDGKEDGAQPVSQSVPSSVPVPIVTVSSTLPGDEGTRLPLLDEGMDAGTAAATSTTAAAAADETMQQEDEQQEEQQVNHDGDTSMTPANGEEAIDADSAAPPAKKSRKRKRRALDSHLAGMTEDEIAAFKASLLRDADGLGGDGSGSGITTRDGGRYSSARINRRATTEDEHDAEEEAELEQQAEVVPPGRLAQDEINARRRVLRTNWRFAAFSQFSSAFPHLCVKDFEIDRLEKDLDGTNPGSYVGEVISRLMYSLTKDSRLAWVVLCSREDELAASSPSTFADDAPCLRFSLSRGDDTKEKPWLVRLRREFLRRDPEHNKLGDGPLSIEEAWEDDLPETASAAAGIKEDVTDEDAPAAMAPAPESATEAKVEGSEPLPQPSKAIPPALISSGHDAGTEPDALLETATPDQPVEPSAEQDAKPKLEAQEADVKADNPLDVDGTEAAEKAESAQQPETEQPVTTEWTSSHGWEELTLDEQVSSPIGASSMCLSLRPYHPLRRSTRSGPSPSGSYRTSTNSVISSPKASSLKTSRSPG